MSPARPALLRLVSFLLLARPPRSARPPDERRGRRDGRTRRRPAALAGRQVGRVREDGDGPRRRKEERGRLDRPRRRLGAAARPHAPREERQHAALFAGRKDARLPLGALRDAAGVAPRPRGRRAAQADRPRGGRLGPARLLAGRQEARVRLRRVPGCPDEACNRKRREELEKDPVKVHRVTHLLTGTGTSGGRTSGTTSSSSTSPPARVTDVTPGDFDSPPSHYEDGGIAFSPDGKEIAFVSNRDGRGQGSLDHEQGRLHGACRGRGRGEADGRQPGRRLRPGVHARRRLDPRARPAPRRLRGRPLVPRRLRPEDEGEADALRRSGSFGFGIHACRATARPCTSPRRAREEGISSKCPSQAASPVSSRRAGTSAACESGAGALVFTEASLTAPPEIFSLPLEEKASSPGPRAYRLRRRR